MTDRASLSTLTNPQEGVPSTYAISRWVRGEPDALGDVLVLTLARSILLAPGFYAIGARRGRLVKGALVSSASITLGIAAMKWLGKDR